MYGQLAFADAPELLSELTQSPYKSIPSGLLPDGAVLLKLIPVAQVNSKFLLHSSKTAVNVLDRAVPQAGIRVQLTRQLLP
jgi:hypothetical protein